MTLRNCCLVLAAMAVGCVDNEPYPNATGVSSLEVTLLQPTQLGSPAAPSQRASEATFNVVAHDANGNVVKKDLMVDVFVSFGGIKTGADAACGADVGDAMPIETIKLHGGMLMNHTTQLPSAFGSTSIWIDEPSSGATGASPTIYFRNPFIAEIQTPADITAPNATFCSTFDNKFLNVDHAQNGGQQLIVTSVFSGAFVVTDTGAPTYNNIYLYAFGQPPSYIVPGKVVTNFSGNYSKFVGFTELNFPLFNVADDSVAAGRGDSATDPAGVGRSEQHQQAAQRRFGRGDLHRDHLRSRSGQPDQ